MDRTLWDHSTFSQNRDRLFNQDVARLFFERIKGLTAWEELASDEHFSVDGTRNPTRTSRGKRNDLIADVEVTEFNGHAEPQAALCMLGRTAKPGSTVGTDKADDHPNFVRGCREQKITPPCGEEGQRQRHRQADHPPAGLQDESTDPQADRGRLWLAQDGGWIAQDQADRPREVVRAVAAGLFCVQPDPHRQPV